MPVFDDIQSLEQTVQQILAATEGYEPIDNLQEAYVESILNSFSDFSNEELGTIDIDNLVKQALRDNADFIDTDLVDKINSDVQSIVDDTMTFYNDQGIALPNIYEAVERRREIRVLTTEFTENMGAMRDELLEGSIEAMKDQFARGTVSRATLRDAIFEAAKGPLQHAETNARMIISGRNRILRDQVRQDAGLTHGYYYGEIRINSRPFCIRCIDRTFDMEQIERMSNGQGLDVKLYCGGWNCIHSWMWVEPGWDAQLKERYEAERSVVDLEDAGLKMKVPERK